MRIIIIYGRLQFRAQQNRTKNLINNSLMKNNIQLVEYSKSLNLQKSGDRFLFENLEFSKNFWKIFISFFFFFF